MTLPPGTRTPEEINAVGLAARERAARTGEPFSVAARAVTGQQAEGDPRPAWAGGDGAEVPVTWAPFTPGQVASLNAFQGAAGFMPEFCYNDECPAIKGTGVLAKREALDAHEDGWHCPACGWTQDWAWSFLADGGWRDYAPGDGLTSGFWAATAAGPVRFAPSLAETPGEASLQPRGPFRPGVPLDDEDAASRSPRAWDYQFSSLPSRTLEDRVAAIEAAMWPLQVTFPGEWTEEQRDEFEAELKRQAADAGHRHHEIRWLPPGRPVLTPEIARALLRECVTVVQPGETLVIRAPGTWSPEQAQMYQEHADAATASGRISFPVLVVLGDELAVAKPGAADQAAADKIYADLGVISLGEIQQLRYGPEGDKAARG